MSPDGVYILQDRMHFVMLGYSFPQQIACMVETPTCQMENQLVLDTIEETVDGSVTVFYLM